MCACTLQLIVFLAVKFQHSAYDGSGLMSYSPVVISLHCKQGMLLVNIRDFTCVAVPDRNRILFCHVFHYSTELPLREGLIHNV